MTYDLEALDFENIRRSLKQFSCTCYGNESISHLEPAPNISVARIMQSSVSAARECIDKGVELNLGDVPNIRVALKQLSTTNGIVNTQALYNILLVLNASQQLLDTIQINPALYPSSMPGLSIPVEVITVINKTVNESGRLRFDASLKLESLNQEMTQLKSEAENLIKQTIRENDLRSYVVDSKPVWQGERAVIAVYSSHLEKIKGVIKGSQSGGSHQLVEPIVVMAKNNEMERLSQKIRAEQNEILKSVTQTARDYLTELNQLLDAIAWVDIAFAAGKLSAQMNAHAPELVESAEIVLNKAYHPMLLIQFIQGRVAQPVPLSIRVMRDKPFVLITGPNTGGKTVVLKTVGLLQLMAQCGLHIPAEENCTLGWFNTVLVDMGDKQSMYHQLSTFAGHIEVMKHILQNANEKSLFLLDELGTGTDPEEGAALAMATIDQLIEKNSMGIVNTHLAPLKEYGSQHERVQNASMVFDENRLSPTYQLEMGKNGKSFGLVIAERNGLPREVTQKAESYLESIQNQTK